MPSDPLYRRKPFQQSLLQARSRPELSSLGCSVLVHLLVISALVLLPSFDGSVVKVDRRRVIPAPLKGKRVIWLKLDQRLPDIAVGKKKSLASPKPETKAPGPTIQASTPKARKSDQLIWVPDLPDITRKRQEIPNVVAFKPPSFAPPPPPKVEPTAPPKPPEPASEPAAPPAPPKAPPKKFVPPPETKRERRASGALTEEPVDTIREHRAIGDLTAVMVGTKPALKDVPAPDANRPGAVSIGSDGGRKSASGSSGGSGQTDGIELATRSAPDSKPGPKSLYVTQSVTFSREALQQKRDAVAVPVRLSMLPARAQDLFGNRTTYLVFLEKLNEINYSGDILIWFAERGQTATGGQAMHPPVPFRISDPIGTQSKAAASLKGPIRLAAIIGRDGFLSGLKLLDSPDDQLGALFLNAAQRWTFLPALRGAERIEVDTLIEIPIQIRH